jgi:hypothetical protein
MLVSDMFRSCIFPGLTAIHRAEMVQISTRIASFSISESGIMLPL